MVCRADHSLQDLRTKLFPYKRKRDKPTDEDFLSASFPAKRKEISLSSLVVSEPGSSTQSRLTGRRKYPFRKNLTLQESTLSVETPVKMKDDYLKKFSSPEAVNRILPIKRKVKKVKLGMNYALIFGIENKMSPTAGFLSY